MQNIRLNTGSVAEESHDAYQRQADARMELYLALLRRFRTVDDPSLPPREPLNEKARAYLNRYLTLNPPQP